MGTYGTSSMAQIKEGIQYTCRALIAAIQQVNCEHAYIVISRLVINIVGALVRWQINVTTARKKYIKQPD